MKVIQYKCLLCGERTEGGDKSSDGSPCLNRSCDGVRAAVRSVRSLRSRILGSVDRSGECWIWTGLRSPCGYGRITVGQKSCKAHRVSYEEWNGRIAPGMVVRHSCDTPLCVNPDHLLVGTQADNIRDRDRRWRVNSKADLAMVLDIRARASSGERHASISKDTGISKSHISRIASGKSWGWVADGQ